MHVKQCNLDVVGHHSKRFAAILGCGDLMSEFLEAASQRKATDWVVVSDKHFCPEAFWVCLSSQDVPESAGFPTTG
jgi:hypothetical protein